MSSITINGDTSGSVILQAPSVAGSTTLTLPSSSGTVITTGNIPTGSILQVVYASSSTLFSTTSTTLQDTGFSATITPSSSSSKILVISNSSIYINENGQGQTYVYGRTSLARSSTQLQEARAASNTGTTAINDFGTSINITYLDSPATTSAVTYKIYVSSLSFNFLTVFNQLAPSSMTLIEVQG